MLLTEHHKEFLSLKGGCTGSSESTLVKMPYCWKSHVMAHIVKISLENRQCKVLAKHRMHISSHANGLNSLVCTAIKESTLIFTSFQYITDFLNKHFRQLQNVQYLLHRQGMKTQGRALADMQSYQSCCFVTVYKDGSR